MDSFFLYEFDGNAAIVRLQIHYILTAAKDAVAVFYTEHGNGSPIDICANRGIGRLRLGLDRDGTVVGFEADRAVKVHSRQTDASVVGFRTDIAFDVFQVDGAIICRRVELV